MAELYCASRSYIPLRGVIFALRASYILPCGKLYFTFGDVKDNSIKISSKIHLDYVEKFCYNGHMAESILRDKAKEFAKEIIITMRAVRKRHNENVLTNQLLRSGTSIGANIHEAQYAQGTADFISKFEIALKECFESEYWLELLFETGYLPEEEYNKLIADCGSLRKMLISTCKTIKENRD